MWSKAIAAVIVGWFGYSAYDYYTGPFYDAPTTSEDEFLLAFGNGFKGVMPGNRDETRKYMSYDASNVPEWYRETWSICRTPENDEVAAFEAAVDMGPGGRLEAVCEINADGDVFVRGWMVTVPDL